MTPKVSVILTCHNYGQYLSGSLGSVLRQSFADLEVIVVDDGSTDATPDVVKPFLSEPRVRFFRTRRRGPSAARNLAARMARGQLLAFLDADDLWMEEKLRRQIEVFDADPALGVVYARRLLIDSRGRQIFYQQPPLFRGLVLEAMFRNNFICFSSSLVSRSAFDNVGPFDENLPLAVDYEFWLRLAKAYRFDFVDEPLVKYRTGHASLSSRAEERLAIVERIMTRFLCERGGRALLSRRLVRVAFAETYYHRGLLRRGQSRLAELRWYLRALAACPALGPAWRGLMSWLLPEAGRRLLRRLLGRPASWSLPEHVASA